MSLNPEYGVFYRGWENYLLAEILSAQSERDTTDYTEFYSNCEDIATAIDGSDNPYPESYYNSSWPADVVVAIASLKKYDELFPPRYDSVIKNWVVKVKSNRDVRTGLIPHSITIDSNKMPEAARGSSTSLMLIFMADIDPEFAIQQFNLFKEKFMVSRFGLSAIREYPKEEQGSGDVDSGPVIFDIGAVATIVSVGTFLKFGEYKRANEISASIESFGFPVTAGGEKKYLFGRLAIADAFIAWSRMQVPNAEIIRNKVVENVDSRSFFLFHLYSFLIILVMLLLIFWQKIRKIVRRK